MAVFASGTHLPLRIVIISACVLSSALLMHVWLPTIVEFVAAQLPSLYATVSACLSPPYLYIVINCIILCIVASSKFQHGGSIGECPVPMQKAIVVPVEVHPKEADVPLVYAVYEDGYVYGVAEEYAAAETQAEEGVLVDEASEVEAAAVDFTDVVVLDLMRELERSDSVELAVMEDLKEKEKLAGKTKPPVSTRFGHRRSSKPSSEVGKALRVTRSRRHDTLESTWRTITDGRAMPLTRHLKKSDTWETRGVRNEENSPPHPRMNKSGTINEEEGQASGKMRRETSLGQEEVNRRVEAFIRKFNEEMRLQREESLNQFQDMINRGAG